MIEQPQSSRRTDLAGADQRWYPGERQVLSEAEFQRAIALERKRTERSQKPFVLMLLRGDELANGRAGQLLGNLLPLVLEHTRETDAVGWYAQDQAIGVLFTELVASDKASILSTILNRVSNMLQGHVTFEQFNQITISFHLFPDSWDDDSNWPSANTMFYPDFSSNGKGIRLSSLLKRTMDIAGSGFLLMMGSPLLLAIALAVKLSSKGPVLFRQQRVGRYGKKFTFLKFRSMYVNNDQGVHKQYVEQLISGGAQLQPAKSNGNGAAMYKLTGDKRITRIGGFLRRTSLDELPQLLNVLLGDMSLVGPRPAIPYEVVAYKPWHRCRVLVVKPGITGLWQVSGRCRLKFDEAVRLDLQYVKQYSVWLDLKILLRTPRAVFLGEGAC